MSWTAISSKVGPLMGGHWHLLDLWVSWSVGYAVYVEDARLCCWKSITAVNVFIQWVAYVELHSSRSLTTEWQCRSHNSQASTWGWLIAYQVKLTWLCHMRYIVWHRARRATGSFSAVTQLLLFAPWPHPSETAVRQIILTIYVECFDCKCWTGCVWIDSV